MSKYEKPPVTIPEVKLFTGEHIPGPLLSFVSVHQKDPSYAPANDGTSVTLHRAPRTNRKYTYNSSTRVAQFVNMPDRPTSSSSSYNNAQ